MRLLHFDLHPGGEDSVDFILSPAAVLARVLLAEVLDEEGVGGLVRQGHVGGLKPEEVRGGDSSGPTLQRELLGLHPRGGGRLLSDPHTLCMAGRERGRVRG